jgi:ferredoxin
MKVVVDFDACEMHGDCVLEAPEIFDLDDESETVMLLAESPPESMRDKVTSAVRMCPVAAILITD